MNRLWSRVGVRTASVALLVVGAATGVYLGQDDSDGPRRAVANSSAVTPPGIDEAELLRQRELAEEAARAQRERNEDAAAGDAAAAAKAAAATALKAEKKKIEAAKKAAEEKAAKEAAERAKAQDDDGKPYDGPVPTSCAGESGHRETGCAMMVDRGFGMDQWPCLEKLWEKESGWNPRAHNDSSGAHGIPQALPGSKMGDGWQSDPEVQIDWGLGYIKGRYGDPCDAWAKSQDDGWY